MQYSVSCVKYDRHGYKPRKRVLLMTDKVSRNSLNIIMEDLILFFSGVLPSRAWVLQSEGTF